MGPRTIRPVALAAAMALLMATPSALADAAHDAADAARDRTSAAEHGMSPADHAAHTEGHGAAQEEAHGAPGAGNGHGGDVAVSERPVELVLGGFAAANLAVLAAAAILRRRPAAVKRRQTLSRIRAAAGAGTATPREGARA